MLSEEGAPGTFGIRSSSLSNETVESRGLYFGKEVMGFRGREGVLSMTVKTNEKSDGPLEKKSILVPSPL